MFKERGAIRNSFGSIISPKEIAIQQSISLEKRVLDFKELIQPVILNKNDLKRYGSIADGGYVISKKAIKNSSFLKSKYSFVSACLNTIVTCYTITTKLLTHCVTILILHVCILNCYSWLSEKTCLSYHYFRLNIVAQ
jgi:hypothetical protein